MGKILDINGKPFDSGQLKDIQTEQVAKIAGLNTQFASHPSRGLTPAKLAYILGSAEQNDIMAQHDLFLDMEEKDAHILTEMSKRKRAMLTLDWSIEPPRGASSEEKKLAAYVHDVFEDFDNFEDLILDMLDGIGHGFSCLELEWELLGKEWLPKCFTHRPQTWFQFDTQTRSQIRLRDNSMDGAELWPFGWVTHVHKAKSGYISRSGLHRVLAWPFLFKNYSVRDLAEFLEIYGVPMRLGTYPSGSSDDEKATLLRAVASIGHDAAGIIPEGMMIDFKEAAKGGSDPFQTMIEWAERSQSKAILGGTLTTQADGKSSTNALGNVHNEVRHDLLAADAKQVASTITRDIIFSLVTLNKGQVFDKRRLPRFRFDTMEAEDLGIYSEALPKLVSMGMKIKTEWAHDKLRIPIPDEGDDILVIAAKEPATDREASATEVAALTAIVENQDEFDIFAEELASDWERVTDPMIAPLMALASEVDSLEAFHARLPDLIKNMDTSVLADSLAQGQFATRIWAKINEPKED